MEILLDNKDGNVWDISEIVADVTWNTVRVGRPSRLEFTLIKNAIYQSKVFKYNNGDIVRVRFQNNNVFYGYIFAIDEGKDEAVRITCYDQIRYLLASDTYVFSNVETGNIITTIASDFGLRVGQIDSTGYRIPTMVEDGQKLLDIIEKANTLTMWNTGRIYVFFDDFGSLSLRNAEDLLLNFYIGDDSLLYDYKATRDIDKDTYNKIKLVQDNKETGKREVYQTQDSQNIARWGTLQLYQTVDEKMNPAQINELLNQLSALKNREARTLKLECIGDIRVRAGCYVPVVIEELSINQPFLVDEVTHRFSGGEHTMSVSLKVV